MSTNGTGRIIANYRDLQDAIADWLDREDLAARIPTFIYLAERKIFRRYRAPNNEKTATFNMLENPNPAITAELAIDPEGRITVPSDYLEILTIQANGRPLDRVSLTEIQFRQQTTAPINSQVTNAQSIQQIPSLFARERENFIIWPPPQGDTLVELIYYCDLSGTLVEDESDNDVLRTAPDLYLYGSLLQAEPFLKPEGEELAMIQVWDRYFEEAFAEIEVQRDNAEFSGSVVSVRNSYSGSARVRSGSVEGTLNGNRF